MQGAALSTFQNNIKKTDFCQSMKVVDLTLKLLATETKSHQINDLMGASDHQHIWNPESVGFRTPLSVNQCVEDIAYLQILIFHNKDHTLKRDKTLLGL